MEAGSARDTDAMNATTHRLPSRQRGVSLLGLMVWAILLGFVAYVAMQVVPTVSEYWTIRRLVDKVAAGQPSSVPEARDTFDKLRQTEFFINSVVGSDLEISKQDDKVVIKFAYTKEIPLGGPAFLLMKYEGRSR